VILENREPQRCAARGADPDTTIGGSRPARGPHGPHWRQRWHCGLSDDAADAEALCIAADLRMYTSKGAVRSRKSEVRRRQSKWTDFRQPSGPRVAPGGVEAPPADRKRPERDARAFSSLDGCA